MTGVALLAAVAAAAAAAMALPGPPAPAATPARTRRPARRERPDQVTSTRRLLPAGAAGVGVVVLVGHPLGVALGVLAALVTWRATGRLEPPVVRRRRERLAADLPHVVDLMAATLAVGLAPPVALTRVAAAVDGPVAEELGTLAARLALGVDPAAAWGDLGRHPQLGPLGRCVSRSVDSGVSVADAMARLADDLRRDLRSQVEARARAVGVRAAVPLGVCMLPAFLLVGVVPLVVGAVPVVLGR